MSASARVYLDWNASAPLRPEAREAVLAALDPAGNPSAIHAEGRVARALIETAREDVAALVGAEPHNVIFTSGATEAAAMALTPDWGTRTFDRLLVSAIEHPCVLAGGRFGADQVTQAPVTGAGTIDIFVLQQLLTNNRRPLVALMAANNETGIVQPVAEAAALTHAAGGLLVCDAVQTVGRLQTDIKTLGVDALLLSAHKLGGPKGVGAMVLADDKVAPAPLLSGGGQEGRLRSGTQNLAGIAGFGAAAKAAKAEMVNWTGVAALRHHLESSRKGHTWSCFRPDTVTLFPGSVHVTRIPNTSLIYVPGMSAQLLLMQLDLAGFAVSAGAACSSGKLARSHVLEAMGAPAEIAGGAVRVSLGPTTATEEIDRLIATLDAIASAHAARRAPTLALPTIGDTHARGP